MTRKRLKTQEDLFIHVLNRWLENERQILSERSIGNKDNMLKNLNAQYIGYKILWEELKEAEE